MKKVIHLLSLIVLAALMGSCGTNTSKTKVSSPKSESESDPKTIIALVVDQTDTSGDRTDVAPKAKILSELLGPTKHGSGTLLLSEITNVSLNAEKAMEFKGLQPDENSHTVKVRKDRFVKSLDAPYKKYLGPVNGTNHSCIYRFVCQVANQLASMEGSNKKLILMSDMVEFSDDGNFYKVGTDNASVENAIKKLLASGATLPKDPDFTVVVLFDSHGNEKKDAAFIKAWNVWKKLFKDNGIQYEEPRANL